jgi:hypothetical protein
MSERHRAAWIGAAVVAAGLTLAGCSGGGASDSARSAADTFMSAAGTLDYAKAATVISSHLQPNMNMPALFGLPSDGVTNFQYSFVSDTTDTDASHTVVYAVKDRSVRTPNIPDNGADILTVIKENGSWKVDNVQ